MRQALISSVVAVAILGHAALGCCWHHAHAACCDEQDSDAAGSLHNHGSCHSRSAHASAPDSHPDGQQSDESDHEHLPCQDAGCTYVPARSVELSHAPAVPVATSPRLTVALPASHTVPGADGAFLCPIPACSPQRCALIQVWRL